VATLKSFLLSSREAFKAMNSRLTRLEDHNITQASSLQSIETKLDSIIKGLKLLPCVDLPDEPAPRLRAIGKTSEH